MRTYLVGGAVRDRLLGRAGGDRDFVVVGATPEAMLAAGYKPVGKDFPVFLHPETKEEHALARTERKSGRGYTGFVVHADPSVTLEDDLARRDLTINAIAEDEHGNLVDPFGGARDLEARVLRHVSPAFAEDPVRLLRVARFAARYAPLGFSVAPETMALMRAMVDAGEVDALVAERVWAETKKALAEPVPSAFLRVLRDSGALAKLFPEVDVLYGVPQRAEYHPEVDTGVHVELVCDMAATLAPGDARHHEHHRPALERDRAGGLLRTHRRRAGLARFDPAAVPVVAVVRVPAAALGAAVHRRYLPGDPGRFVPAGRCRDLPRDVAGRDGHDRPVGDPRRLDGEQRQERNGTDRTDRT